VVDFGAENLSVGSNDLNTTFSGPLFGCCGGSLTKIGTGKLVLRHANDYTGGTTINGGKLVVNNERGSSTVLAPCRSMSVGSVAEAPSQGM
jgi:fibronectin-binding autotransporter adhesin